MADQQLFLGPDTRGGVGRAIQASAVASGQGESDDVAGAIRAALLARRTELAVLPGLPGPARTSLGVPRLRGRTWIDLERVAALVRYQGPLLVAVASGIWLWNLGLLLR